MYCVLANHWLYLSYVFLNLNWLVVSGSMILDRGDSKYDAFVPLTFNIFRSSSFKFFFALLFLIEISVLVLVSFKEVFFIVSVIGSHTFLKFYWKFCFRFVSCNRKSPTWLFNGASSSKSSSSCLFLIGNNI